ncbi:hypothetical protein ACFVH9_15695 [Streptomyces hirsutus]|uniref:hypothetical protein n=1 Tax=Streptomyces hirsutus TaxID=35620 RepID=UPI003640AB6D
MCTAPGENRPHSGPATRFPRVPDGNAHIAVAGQEDTPLTDTREALRNLILEIKSGKADHLL